MLFVITRGISFGQTGDVYTTTVPFPVDYVVGDYIEFLRVTPADVGTSGYYEISIAYTKGNIAAAATHVALIGHSDPDVWREVGRINSNGYIEGELKNFTIDCNTAYNNVRFRIRTIATYGISAVLPVDIKIRSINKTVSWTALNNTGNDQSANSFLPMTNEWDLYVRNPRNSISAFIAIKALTNGNVGIGTANPQTNCITRRRSRIRQRPVIRDTIAMEISYICRGQIPRGHWWISSLILTSPTATSWPASRTVLRERASPMRATRMTRWVS